MGRTYSCNNRSFPRDVYDNLVKSEYWGGDVEISNDLDSLWSRQLEIFKILKDHKLDQLPQIIKECKFVLENYSFYPRQNYWRFYHNSSCFLYGEELKSNWSKMMGSSWAKYENGDWEDTINDLSLFLKWDKSPNEYNNLSIFGKQAVDEESRFVTSVRQLYVYIFACQELPDKIKKIIELEIDDFTNVDGWWNRPLILNKVLYWCILKYQIDLDIDYLVEKASFIYTHDSMVNQKVSNVEESITELLLVEARYSQILLERYI